MRDCRSQIFSESERPSFDTAASPGSAWPAAALRIVGGGEGGVGRGLLRTHLRCQPPAIENGLRDIGEHAAGDELEQLAERVRRSADIATDAERGIKLRLCYADPGGCSGKRAFGATHVRALAQRIGRNPGRNIG